MSFFIEGDKRQTAQSSLGIEIFVMWGLWGFFAHMKIGFFLTCGLKSPLWIMFVVNPTFFIKKKKKNSRFKIKMHFNYMTWWTKIFWPQWVFLERKLSRGVSVKWHAHTCTRADTRTWVKITRNNRKEKPHLHLNLCIHAQNMHWCNKRNHQNYNKIAESYFYTPNPTHVPWHMFQVEF